MAAIREAVLEEIHERGYAALSFEGVARRAGTSKPVLYRRYPTRAHMAVDAWTAGAPLVLDTASCGDLRTDLIDVLTVIHDRFQRAGVTVFRGVIAEADDELLARMTNETEQVILPVLRDLHRSARVRGELGDAAPSDRTLLVPLVLLRHELFFTRGPVDRAVIAELVDEVTLPAWRAASGRAVAAGGRDEDVRTAG